jgi:hypothetical protein
MKPDLRHAPIDLWRIASRYLNEFYALFGDSAEIAMQRIFSKDAFVLLLRWLRGAEILLRHLLLLEAALIGARPALRKTTKTRAGPKARAPKLRPFHSLNPDEWKVSFRCFLGPPASRQRLPAPRRGYSLPRIYASWRIAQRCEAVLRVFNDPAAYAARLARRLFATPAHAATLLKTPPGTDDLIGAESFARLCAATGAAILLFNSS